MKLCAFSIDMVGGSPKVREINFKEIESFIGTAKGLNTPRLNTKLKIRFQPISQELALR